MRMSRYALSSLTLALLVASPSYGLDLAEAYAKAQSNDPAWSAARNTWQAEDMTTDMGRAGLLPSLVISGSLSKTEVDSAASGKFDGKQIAAKATQPLFNADAWFAYKSAKAVSSQAEANFRNAEQDLALRVSQAYFAVLSAQETLAYAEAEESALARQMDQAQQRFDVGLIAITDVLAARASFDGARAGRISTEAALNAAQENLAAIIGEAPGKLVALKADAPMVKPTPADPDEWVKLAREKNYEIKAAEEGYRTAKAASNRSRAGYLPTVNLYASYSDVDNSYPATLAAMTVQNGTSTSVGLEAQWVVLSGGSTYASSKQSSYRAAAAQDNVTATERRVVNNARTSFLNVSADSYRVDARKQALTSSESSLDATKAGYEVGTRTIVDVLMAERSLYAAKRDYAASRYDYVLNTLRLKASTGQLTAIDIKELNGWLDPNASVVSSPEKPVEPAKPVKTR